MPEVGDNVRGVVGGGEVGGWGGVLVLKEEALASEREGSRAVQHSVPDARQQNRFSVVN
jgi:hypothetical protein